MASTDDLVTLETEIQPECLKGVCKWFNNKSGYGFLTVTEGDKKDTDIFVHHSYLRVENENQYKYLVEGEYVDFILSNVDNNKGDNKHQHHATNVRGVNGGKLMCETRNEKRNTLSKNDSSSLSFNYKSRQSRQSKQTKQVKQPLEVSLSNETNETNETNELPQNNEKNDWTPIKPKGLANSGRGRGRPPKKV